MTWVHTFLLCSHVRRGRSRPLKPTLVQDKPSHERIARLSRHRSAASRTNSRRSHILKPLIVCDKGSESIDKGNIPALAHLLTRQGNFLHRAGLDSRKRRRTNNHRGNTKRRSSVGDVCKALATYPNAQVVWVQDEPKNQGAWPYFALNLFPELGIAPALVSRPESATTAAGRASLHREQAADILRRAFS